MTVWIANFRGHDFSPAKKWGELKYITVGYVPKSSPDGLFFTVVKKIIETDAEDWLLPSGTIPMNVIIGAIWFFRHKKIKLLVWDRKREGGGGYKQMIFTQEHLEHLLESLCPEATSTSQSESQ